MDNKEEPTKYIIIKKMGIGERERAEEEDYIEKEDDDRPQLSGVVGRRSEE